MKDKVRIFLEDDNEILGNGGGDPFELQYLNTKEYIKILVSNNIKSTFYIDMGHYVFLKNNLNKSEKCKNFLNSIEKTIEILLENEMDVQLHIHSQWQNAFIDNDIFKVTNDWNLGMLSNEKQVKLLNEAYNSLSNIINIFIFYK